mgnify:CR=1 FL=1
MRQVLAFLLAVLALARVPAQAKQAPAGQDAPGTLNPGSAEPGSIEAIPEALRGEALELRVLAVVHRGAAEGEWQSADVKYTLVGMPVTLKMVGSSVVVFVTLTPYPTKDADIAIIAQGQVWFREEDGSLRYRSTVEPMSVAYGEKVFFYPLGIAEDGSAPLRVEIILRKYAKGDTARQPEKTSP